MVGVACARAEVRGSPVLEAGCLLWLRLLYRGSVRLHGQAQTDHTELLHLSEVA